MDYAGASKTFTGNVKKSYSTGNVIATGDNVGGLVGYQQASIYTNNHYENSYSYIQECYATGKVETTGKNVGGLVGYMHAYNKTTAGYIQNSYAIIQNSFATRWINRKYKCRCINRICI